MLLFDYSRRLPLHSSSNRRIGFGQGACDLLCRFRLLLLLALVSVVACS